MHKKFAHHGEVNSSEISGGAGYEALQGLASTLYLFLVYTEVQHHEHEYIEIQTQMGSQLVSSHSQYMPLNPMLLVQFLGHKRRKFWTRFLYEMPENLIDTWQAMFTYY